MINAHLYDIESLDNVFSLCNYKPEENIIDVYYLVDNPLLTSSPTLGKDLLNRVWEKNPNFNGAITLYDLHYADANEHFAKTFGLSDARNINDPNSKSSFPDEFRLTCDTDPNYNEKVHPYFFGYNSYNYDTTMLALYFYEIYSTSKNGIANFRKTTAHEMRVYNDELFSHEFKEKMPSRLTQSWDYQKGCWTKPDYNDQRYKIRKSMLMTGRHLDAARLNEKQAKVGLKRLLGMLGYQILESDKLRPGTDRINSADEFYDLIAYNCSDVINLNVLLTHKPYKTQFALKKGLLSKYPELVYEKLPDKYAPDIRPEKVRRDRLTIDSSSAQFSTKSLCPYGNLKDIPAVSYMYPSEKKSKELGIPRVNVLEETRKFFYSNFPQPELRAEFDRIYMFYKSIEGKNFNDSKYYNECYGRTGQMLPVHKLASIPKCNTCLYYYDANGNPTSCFVTFSTGGIHGAEYNVELYMHDIAVYNQLKADMDYVQSQYPEPTELKKAKKIIFPDGSEHKATEFLKAGSTMKSASYKDISSKAPQLFVISKKGDYKLNPKYVYTSADPTNHEDFKSYYPNMLRMLSAFWNDGLGYDRYAEIFDEKEKYGKLMKDKSLSEEERDDHANTREGTKLILNSASGAADATFENSTRLNNLIISMRIIGQLFTYRIGQAQAIKGAKITSTNTDGLYSVLEATINNKILAKESADINVEIEPEPTYLISKDSNNRLEMNPDTGEIESASGGTLACREKPNPTKSLNHPAIIDWALAEYLIVAAFHHKGLSLSAEFNDEIGLNILKAAKQHFEPTNLLKMFQNVIASSIGSSSYIFATKEITENVTPIILQHYNRVFIMKDNAPNTVHLMSANAKAITPPTKKKRANNGERPQQNDALALSVLNAHGVTKIEQEKEATVVKVTNIEPEWFMRIENRSLYYLTKEETDEILDNLDYDKYLQLLRECFNKNWRNKVPLTPLRKTENNNTAVTPTAETTNTVATAKTVSAPQSSEQNVAANTQTSNEPTTKHSPSKATAKHVEITLEDQEGNIDVYSLDNINKIYQIYDILNIK